MVEKELRKNVISIAELEKKYQKELKNNQNCFSSKALDIQQEIENEFCGIGVFHILSINFDSSPSFYEATVTIEIGDKEEDFEFKADTLVDLFRDISCWSFNMGLG